ncbi:hypothetical protein [Mucilaginibacter sp. FT3.2]|uniref:hypothetical protein n=1 Tax=Mucilaginibacter sp. FT3.2 TaxID=2723090 RepID=UPI00161C01EE|nr:hypothetical protein [Mucilaginibacter sp. FT3.2]MBB6230410.1 preprotein translocase subunit YajC [Mucilaginibacter sp. FT3.2]
MKTDPKTQKSILRNALLSVFIYLLPILLMFGSFYITGKRPWKQQQGTLSINKTINPINKKP